MPRPRNTVPTTQKTIQIPEDLLHKIELIFMDPVKGRLPHGFFSDLVNGLLRNWVKQQVQEKINDAQRETQPHPRDNLGTTRALGGNPTGPASPGTLETSGDSSPPQVPGGVPATPMSDLGNPNLQRDPKEGEGV